MQHEAAQPDIILAGRRIAREVHAGGDVEAAVLAVLEMHWKLGEVDVGAGHHHGLHRCFLAADLDDLRLAAQSPQDLGQELLRRRAEGFGEARAARERVADQRIAAWAGRLEQHGFRIGFERTGNRGELGGARSALELAFSELFDKVAQPVGVVVDASGCLARDLVQPHGCPCLA